MRNDILPIYDIQAFKYLGAETNFYANTLKAHIAANSSSVFVPHRHNFYFSAICTKGSGTHEIELNNYDIHPGSVWLMSPGQVHNWQVSKNIDGYVMFHTKEFFDMYFSHEKIENYPFFCCYRNSPQVVLKKDATRDNIEIYKSILNEYNQTGLMKFQKISALVNILYINLSREYIPKVVTTNLKFNYLTHLKNLEKLIETNYRTVKSPKDYAQMMHVSEKHLNRICKVTLNKTVSEMITDRIILESKKLMVYSDHNISEIVNELGYEDHSYFSRLFKKKLNQTPVEFINKHRK